jgi:glycosyltransferase involved in cell wall biosynthesis
VPPTKRPATGRVPVLFVSWAFVKGRSAEIAAALGGTASSIYPTWLSSRRLAPLRYAVSSVLTVAALLRHRPRAVVVTNPPIFPGLICWAYGILVRAPVLLDSHTGSFGLKGNLVSERLLPLHRWLAERVDAVLVTTEDLGEVVRSWGGNPLVVHEAPPSWSVSAPGPIAGRPRVLFVGVFAGDEPVDEVLAAARLLPGCDVQVTGDLRKADPELVASAPPNVTFVGFLPEAGYAALIDGCDMVLSLTTEPVSVMRAAYEAVYARRPLVLSDWPNLRELFPFGVPVANDAAAIAEGVRSVVQDDDRYRRRTEEALAVQERRWADQISALRVLTGQRCAG